MLHLKQIKSITMPRRQSKASPVGTKTTNSNNKRVSAVRPATKVRKINSLQYISRMMEKAMNNINNKISELENRMSTPSGSSDNVMPRENFIQPIIQPGTSTVYYPVAQMPTERPKFPFKGKHPVTFIEDLTAYLRRSAPEARDIIDIVIDCLENESRNWARIYRDRWTVFEDFKRDFLDTYWGEAEQNELRRRISQNSWDGVQSMLSHFITLCGQAKMLTYPIQERQLINDIMNHFPKDVQYAWSTSNYTSILQATEFLRKLDNINKQNNFSSGINAHSSSVQRPEMAAQQQNGRGGLNRKRIMNTRSMSKVIPNKKNSINGTNRVDNDNNVSIENSVSTENLN